MPACAATRARQPLTEPTVALHPADDTGLTDGVNRDEMKARAPKPPPSLDSHSPSFRASVPPNPTAARCDIRPCRRPVAPLPQGEAGQASWPFGQCPVYEDGDFRIGQSDAILRYIARQHGLYGSGAREESLIDSFLQGVEDLRK